MARRRPAGSVEVAGEVAQELLQAADQYMLDGLKRLAEATIGGALTVASLLHTHELADDYTAPQLAHTCAMYALQHYKVPPPPPLPHPHPQRIFPCAHRPSPERGRRGTTAFSAVCCV